MKETVVDIVVTHRQRKTFRSLPEWILVALFLVLAHAYYATYHTSELASHVHVGIFLCVFVNSINYTISLQLSFLSSSKV